MNLLFSMSLAGSLVFLVYLILRPFTVRYFSSAWRYRFLKLVLIFYLLPYQYFKYHYYDAFFNVFFHSQYQSPESLSGFSVYDYNKLIFIDAEGNYSLKNGKIIFVVLAIWSIAVISFAVYQVIKYISCKRTLQQILSTPDSNSYVILNQCKKHVHIKKKVELFSCSHINTPFTIGVFSPHIIFPDALKDEKSLYMAISHELTHIRNHDILIKFLALLVMALHCFNPLTYFLYWEICRVYECVCDEAVTQNMTQEEKEAYKLLIVEMARKPPQTNLLFANALSSNFKVIKERITLMDKSITSSKYMRIASFAVVIILLVISPLPVLAYTPMTINISENPNDDFNFEGELYSKFGQDDICDFDIYEPFLELGTDHEIFIDDRGISSIILETTTQTERASCNHAWNSGRIYNHIKNNNGGCTVNIYEGQICSKCNESIKGDLFSSIQYPKCPH